MKQDLIPDVVTDATTIRYRDIGAVANFDVRTNLRAFANKLAEFVVFTPDAKHHPTLLKQILEAALIRFGNALVRGLLTEEDIAAVDPKPPAWEERLDVLMTDAFAEANHPAMLDYVRIKFELRALRKTVERFALCADHRDKLPPYYEHRCAICDGERRGREIARDEFRANYDDQSNPDGGRA